MLNAFLVALAVFICVGGAELIGFTMLNRPIVIGPLVGLFLGDLHTGVVVGASLEAVFMGVVNIGGARNRHSRRSCFCDYAGQRVGGRVDAGASYRYFGTSDQDGSVYLCCRNVCQDL